MKRRELLQLTAALPLLPLAKTDIVEASLTACYQMSKSSLEDVQLARSILLSLANTDINPEHKAQCYLLLSSISYHAETHKTDVYIQNALKYAKESKNSSIVIAAMKEKGVAYELKEDWYEALNMYKSAKDLLTKDTPGILQSWVYAGLASAQAHHHIKGAEENLKRSYDLFENTTMLGVRHGIVTSQWETGDVYTCLGQYDRALEAFNQIIDLESGKKKIPQLGEAGYTGILRSALQTAIGAQDKNLSTKLWERGISKAKKLQSATYIKKFGDDYSTIATTFRGTEELRDLL